ncbi:hypothetical protein [Virgibacillus ihumii]|uniref:hypothetical protein n=1 Tax=Virgibacillus ihumii TaxID=2686091 RepID=UPI00157C5A60|nr:hypothetical protein [Virgibacillus ihumii]
MKINKFNVESNKQKYLVQLKQFYLHSGFYQTKIKVFVLKPEKQNKLVKVFKTETEPKQKKDLETNLETLANSAVETYESNSNQKN